MTAALSPEVSNAQHVPPAATAGLLAHVTTMIVGAIYAWFLVWTYQELSQLWDYLGFWYKPPVPSVTFGTIAASALLGLFLPTGNWTIVGFAKWVLYFILFIPALMIPPQQGILPDSDLLLLEVLIWCSAAAFIVLLRDGKPIPVMRLKPDVLWSGVVILALLGNAAVVIVFRDTMNLAGIEQVYEQRAAAASVGGAAIGYVMGLLSGAINPFLLVIGLTRRRPAFIVLALIGQVLIYATLAGKVVLGSTLLTVGTFFAFRHGRVVFARIHAAALAFAVLGPIVSTPRATIGLISTISDLVYMRILVLPGVLVGAYSEFFLRFPVTYLSHSLIGRPFSTYPYGEESIGQVIGRYVTPTANASVNNYNANFIAADGITGFGAWGVPLIFLLVGGWLWFASRLVGQTNRPIVCAILMPFVVSLADASLFTAILTGGGAAAALLLYLYRSAESFEASHAAHPSSSAEA